MRKIDRESAASSGAGVSAIKEGEIINESGFCGRRADSESELDIIGGSFLDDLSNNLSRWQRGNASFVWSVSQ
jgi:hypothetical protein